MGGCVVSLMNLRNGRSTVPHPDYQAYARYGNQVTIVEGSETANASPIYRMSHVTEAEHHDAVKNFYSEFTSIETLQRLCKERGNTVALSYRILSHIEKSQTVDATGKTKTLETYCFQLNRKTISYERMWHNLVSFGRGLAELGLPRRSCVAIFEDTRWEWLTSLYGIWTQDMVAATVYANLGEEALAYALKETECVAIVCNGKQVPKLLKLLTATKLHNTTVLYVDDLPSGVDVGAFSVVSWLQVVETGSTSEKEVHIPTGSKNCDDVALVMYTSGTTGNPKGVMHTHGSLAAGIRAIRDRVEDLLGERVGEETYCSYLPLAHIMEYAVVTMLMMRGTVIGFGSPRTLTDAFAKPHGDFMEFKPDLIVAVPRILDTVRKAVEAKLPPKGSLRRTVFDRAYESRLKSLQEGMDTPYWNKEVFGQARAVMGGRVRAMLSGGGPLSPSTQEFINVAFGMVVQGWGMTETVCVGAIQRLGNLDSESVGQILLSEEVRLLDTEQYKHTDKPRPRGEILLRGPFVCKGYFKQPELSKGVFDADGWFHTGDVGALAENGTLSIVGRVKALAKNANGEYIALEMLESEYGQDKLCTPNGVCVLVNPHRSYICALVLTEKKLAEQFAAEHGIAGVYPDLLENPEFHVKAAQSLAATAKKAGKMSFELVRNVRVLSDEWTPENGLLTAAMKLRRSEVETHYAAVIAELFRVEA